MHLFHFFPRQNGEFVFNAKLFWCCSLFPFGLRACLIVYFSNYFSYEAREVTLGCCLDSMSRSCRKPSLKLSVAKPFPSQKTPSVHLNKPFQKMQHALQSRLSCQEERGLQKGHVLDLNIGQGSTIAPKVFSMQMFTDLFLHCVIGLAIKLDQYLASLLMYYHTLLKRSFLWSIISLAAIPILITAEYQPGNR